MKNTVIFDLDGLLVDSEIVAYQLFRDLGAEYDSHVSIEEYIRTYSGKTADNNMRVFLELHGLPISIEEGFAFMDAKEKEYIERGIPLKAGAGNLLAYLKEKRYKIVLASSSSRERAVEILARNQVIDYFDGMVFGTEVKRGKPEPDIFIRACECAQEAAENCLVLEDSEAGIQAAHSAGIDVICIPDLKTPREEFCAMAAARMTSLEEVIPWLENGGNDTLNEIRDGR